MLSLILVKKIFSLFIIMLMGFLLVKSGKLKAEDSKKLSIIAAYAVFPCIMLSAFNVEKSPEIVQGLLISIAAAFILGFGQIIPFALLKKPLKLSAVEHACVIYPNTGNLILPLISYILGPEYIIYCSGFMCLQMVLMWSHGRAVLCGEKGMDIKAVITNINIIAIIIGGLMFAFDLHFPAPVQDAIDSVGTLTGPIVMLVTGMLMGGMKLEKFRQYKRLPLVVALRMLLIPIFLMLLFKLSGLENMGGKAPEIMIIAMLSASAPTASTITQLAQLFGADADYANVITLTTTLLCIATLPLMVLLWQLF